MPSYVFLIRGAFFTLPKTHVRRDYLTEHFYRRENTVLRGQLFERNEEDPSVLEVRKSVYVIPSALIAEQFTPCPPPPSDKSMYF